MSGPKSTFSQREGYEVVPEPQLGDLSSHARIAIWNVFDAHLSDERDQCWREDLDWREADVPPQDEPRRVYTWEQILEDVHVSHDHRAHDDFAHEESEARLRARIENDPSNRVIDLIEFVLSHRQCPPIFVEEMSSKFESPQFPYEIDLGPPVVIQPAVSMAEGAELKRNLEDLREVAGLDGCNAHLQVAQRLIRDGDWAGSVRESIHAVESVAKRITPGAKTLGAALNSLEKQGMLQHKALKEAFSKLYGYTSDEKGIRHALADESVNVTIDEAVFMLGACASFASYLWRKHKAAGDTP